GPGAGFLVLRPARAHRLELPADRDHRGLPAPLHGVPLVVLLCLGGEIRDPSLRHSAPAGFRPGLRAAPPAFPGVDHRALFGDAHADPAQGPALPVPAGGPDAPAVGDGRTAGPGPIPPSGAVVAPPRDPKGCPGTAAGREHAGLGSRVLCPGRERTYAPGCAHSRPLPGTSGTDQLSG